MPLPLATLLAVNRDLLAQRWTRADLADLLHPRHGVVSGFEVILDDLGRLLARDLGDTPPREPQGARTR